MHLNYLQKFILKNQNQHIKTKTCFYSIACTVVTIIVEMLYYWYDFCKELKENILRLGGFQTVCTFIACIGKLWGGDSKIF